MESAPIIRGERQNLHTAFAQEVMVGGVIMQGSSSSLVFIRGCLNAIS
jgi:hypothetical protein